MTLKKSIGIWAAVSLLIVMLGSYVFLGMKTKMERFLLGADNLFWSLMKDIPNDLEAVVKNGEVTINRERPYCLMFNQKAEMGILFDNKTEPTMADDENCKTWLTVGQNYVKVKEDNGSYKVYQIDKEANYTINKTEIEKFYRQASPKLEKAVWWIYWIGPWVVWIFVFGWGMLVGLWYAWVAKAALRIFQARRDLQFLDIYGVMLFLMSVWVVVRYGIEWLIMENFGGKNMTFDFPFLNTIILAILALIWYSKLEGKFNKKN